MNAWEIYINSDLDLSILGLTRGPEEAGYFCTPLNAKVIGWAGVDGIHYCTIEGQGENIFAVSPMNFGDYIHPIAESFEVLLRLLLSCHSMDAIEQCYTWAADQFEAYLMDYPVTPEIQEKQKKIRELFKLDPLEDVFGYIKQLQGTFDLSTIQYSEEYYETLGIEPPVFEEKKWTVSYEGGFWSNKGKPGKEIRIDKAFCWGEEKWYIPSVYICEEGLVVDYCKEADCAAVKTFIDKWDLLNEHKNHYTNEQRDQMSLEHPLSRDVNISAIVNGQLVRENHGCGLSWIPSVIVPHGGSREDIVERLMDHYNLDPDKAWSINRCCIPWTDGDVLELELQMKPRLAQIPGTRFVTNKEGERITFSHPITGAEHRLTVQELESQELSQTHFPDDTLEYPKYFKTMTYVVEPDIDRNHIAVLDCADGDLARPKKGISQEKGKVSTSSIGVIGGADGPTAIIYGSPVPRTLHAACSSIHFEKVDRVEWRIIFREKLKDDIQVKLI